MRAGGAGLRTRWRRGRLPHDAARVARDEPRAAIVSEIGEAPADENDEAVLEAHQVHQVHEEPEQPGHDSGEVEMRELRYAGRAADDGEVALVEVEIGRASCRER